MRPGVGGYQTALQAGVGREDIVMFDAGVETLLPTVNVGGLLDKRRQMSALFVLSGY